MTAPLNWLNYHHLFYFREIANRGSISAAAKRLRLGHPTLSSQLRELEDRLGMQLFERHHKKLLLTESGRIALEYANDIFGKGEEMIEALNDRLTPSRIHIQLGALDSVPKQVLFELVQSCYRQSEASVTILEGSDDELIRLLLSYKVDLVMTNHVPQLGSKGNLRARSLGKLKVVVCGAKKYHSLKKGFPHSLNQAPFVLPTYHSRLRQDLTQYFQFHKISPDIVGETQDTGLQKIMGVEGVGLIPLPELAVRSFVKKGDLFTIGEIQGVFEEFFLVASERKFRNPIAARLFESFRIPVSRSSKKNGEE